MNAGEGCQPSSALSNTNIVEEAPKDGQINSPLSLPAPLSENNSAAEPPRPNTFDSPSSSNNAVDTTTWDELNQIALALGRLNERQRSRLPSPEDVDVDDALSQSDLESRLRLLLLIVLLAICIGLRLICQNTARLTGDLDLGGEEEIGDDDGGEGREETNEKE
ncbi:hypothetical protein BDN72DRAFT_900108 [Pluteus cervinus]|uniref:Uncharacterized protein n=1 Tax=Pluteus cervinus TaxID=181527 RepID=A0ACD3AK58_9AGAR|nr:hypothetical protein BDN72DRAFT_900108 [Pluteus cervinus]